ncbi:hypothetical protein [Paenibacillus daejeonensis]|uniref:hypothetical protein n=1 Tax=Paenibacillus daejeonensis TaxID=135193 RepID=UPI0003784D3F|nr:hypothetical protein [Paenibacillus daejeonensis]
MFKNRSYMLGLGTGIILGCLLLVLMQAAAEGETRLMDFENNSSASAPEDGAFITDEELQGMLAAEAERVQAELAAQAAAEPEPEERPEPAPEDFSQLHRVVRIKSGTTLQTAAGMLEDYGLIDNRLQFITKMKEEGGKIRRGTFYFEGLPDEEEVLRIITGPPITLE